MKRPILTLSAHFLLLCISIVALSLAFAACSSSENNGGGETISVTAVTLNKSKLKLNQGTNETLIATVLPTNATNRSVTWDSSDVTVATVSQTGLVSAIAQQGNATITVETVDGGKTETCYVTVVPPGTPVVSVTISPKNSTIAVNATQQFSATVTGTDNEAVTWTTSNGTITETGLYTAPDTPDTYTVTATSVEDTTESDTATVTVSSGDNPTISVSISPQNPTVTVGGTQEFSVTVSGTSNTEVTWAVDSSIGGTIDASGLYTAPNTTGDYVIRATSKADPTKYGTSTVTVISSVVIPIVNNKLSTGEYHTVVLKSNGSLWTWGHNDAGQLGTGESGSTTDRYVPTKIGDNTTWVTVSAGDYHTLALRTDGSLWAWGRNVFGQLGTGESGAATNLNVPTQVGNETNWIAISGGGSHTIALKTDGSLWAWGNNEYGQLGNSSRTNRNTPTRIGNDYNWTAISAGYEHTMALKSDGSLWAWGSNEYNQLGDGTTATDRTSPTQIGSDTGWVAVSAGQCHTIAVKSDGSIWAWGRNNFNQLGDGTTTGRAIPTKIGNDTNWATSSAGGYFTMSLKSDGSLWGWGRNNFGQLGDGTMTDRSVPTGIDTATNWTLITTGLNHTFALKSDGTLWAWGSNSYGKLGDGTLVERHIPTYILDTNTN